MSAEERCFLRSEEDKGLRWCAVNVSAPHLICEFLGGPCICHGLLIGRPVHVVCNGKQQELRDDNCVVLLPTGHREWFNSEASMKKKYNLRWVEV